MVLERDQYRCVRCSVDLAVDTAHIDQISSGKLGTNRVSTLWASSRPCHVLRADQRHPRMIAGALRDGIIGPDWRDHLWEG